MLYYIFPSTQLQVIATCFDFNQSSFRRAYESLLVTICFCAFGIPDGLQFPYAYNVIQIYYFRVLVCSSWRRSVAREKYRRLQTQAKCSKYRRNIEGRLGNPCCCGNTLCITYSECVSVALVTQHATRIHRTLLPSVACLVVPLFSHHFKDGITSR